MGSFGYGPGERRRTTPPGARVSPASLPRLLGTGPAHRIGTTAVQPVFELGNLQQRNAMPSSVAVIVHIFEFSVRAQRLVRPYAVLAFQITPRELQIRFAVLLSIDYELVHMPVAFLAHSPQDDDVQFAVTCARRYNGDTIHVPLDIAQSNV